MISLERFVHQSHLKFAFIAYALLAITDTVHHYHAAVFLGDAAAMHAAVIGVVLLPTAIVLFVLYLYRGTSVCLWLFLSIAMVAIALPGLYHGGWNHLVKVLAHLRIDSPHTDIATLFPLNNFDLWFYEFTGLLDFLFAVLCSYFIFMLIVKKHESA